MTRYAAGVKENSRHWYVAVDGTPTLSENSGEYRLYLTYGQARSASHRLAHLLKPPVEPFVRKIET